MSCHGVLAAEPLLASGRSSEKLSLPTLRSRMKCDPGGYESELLLLRSQFNSYLELFHQQADMNFTSITGIASDPTVAKDLGDRAEFLAHLTPFYPNHLADFPKILADLLHRAARSLPSGLRRDLARALIHLVNRQIVDLGETLSLFIELQTLRDKKLTKLAFAHVVDSISHMNQKHKNESKNRALKSVLFKMLQKEDEAQAKRVLVTLCVLYRRKVWFDDRTANAISTASFHPSSIIMKAALSFLLDYEKIENDEDSDDESTESPHIINKHMIYKANHQGTNAGKRKKRRKLERIERNMRKQQCLSSERSNYSYYSPLNHLKDEQGFAERLFSRLQTCNEGFKVKMMMLKLIARVVGLHRLTLLNFYPFVQKYIQPHQHDVINLLAAVVQACHDRVPPDVVEPLFKKIVNQFVHDRSRPEAITVGLNAVREICIRMPLLMNEDLLQDLALYKKSHEKAVSVAARSLITLFREVCPSLLVKKDRGWPIDPKARPKAYGEVDVVTDVPGAELLQNIDNDDEQESGDSDDSACIGTGNDQENDQMSIDDGDDENQLFNENTGSDEDEAEDNDVGSEDEDERSSDYETGISDADDDVEDKGDNLVDSEPADEEDSEVSEHEVDDLHSFSDESLGTKCKTKDSIKKRKFSDFNGKLMAANKSLPASKKLVGITMGHSLPDGILSNEDFRRIEELKHGLAKSAKIKVPTSDQLSLKRVDASMLEVHVRKKMSKVERLALVKAGREERGKYQARTAVKQKKTGGLSNQQKEHKKKMPLTAKRDKVTRSRIEKNKKRVLAGKQFRGRKAWK